uniref:Phytanoyl-CoA dioxygenase n=1 Tax=Haptolina ericina TaxID=156174 RepID=A0A7S3EX40_9EUKA
MKVARIGTRLVRSRHFASASSHIKADIVQQYAADGAVLLRGVLSREEVSTLREAIDWNLLHPGPLAGVASHDADPGLFLEDFCNWDRVVGYQDVIFNSALGEVAAALMNSKTVRLYHDHVLVKEAWTQQATPWHQDQPYYNIVGRQNVSFWIPVDRGAQLPRSPMPRANSSTAPSPPAWLHLQYHGNRR